MDERVLGDVPSEGSESGRRFGIYRAYTPDPKLHSVCKLRIVFATAVAAVVAFSILYPLMQYSARSNRKPLIYPGILNRTVLLPENPKPQNVQNCSTKVFSFGIDRSDHVSTPLEEENDVLTTQTSSSIPDVRRFDDDNLTDNEENSSRTIPTLTERRDLNFQRSGRSRWPLVSTPYPYYKLPANDLTVDKEFLSHQETNIFAIPYDLGDEDLKEKSTSKLNFTPYTFTPFPNFTDNYAQLLPYKHPQNTTNLHEVMKYLKNNAATDRSSSDEHLEKNDNSRMKIMKVSGTYMMPLDRRRPGEIILTSGSESGATPFFNGHAYVADPFNKFRPPNPSDVNRLIPIKSGMDVGPRFRKPVSFVPTSSVAVDLTRQTFPSPSKDLHETGSHTVAIFHPPSGVSQTPPLYLQPPTVAPSEKPLSVTLDIYPVTIDSDPDVPESTVGPSTPAVRERGRLNPKWRPKATERPRWRPQAHGRRPSTDPGQPATDNHMIVHLNLFPNKRKPYTFPRRNRGEKTRDTKSTLLSGGQFLPRGGSNEPDAATINQDEHEDPSLESSSVEIHQPEIQSVTNQDIFQDRMEGKEEEVEERSTTRPDKDALLENDKEESDNKSETNNSESEEDKRNMKEQRDAQEFDIQENLGTIPTI